MIAIHHVNLLDWAHTYTGPKFHALLCDPPYHLTSITERFGKRGAVPARYGTDGAFQRASRGFMGKQWDGGDIAFRRETWAALAEHLYPGAFGMAFASSRGWHRMAVAIEDAGLIIHPVILAWTFGSGFPKATRIDTQIDRQAGAGRQTIGQRKHAPKFDAAGHGYREKDNGYNSRERLSFDVTAPATELAADWAGHRYGLQSLKPALEPIIVFQKPYAGRPVDCIAETGAGALWIDGGRIETNDDTRRAPVEVHGITPFGSGMMGGAGHPAGRWPANLILQHTPDCTSQCAPHCPIAALGAQSGECTSAPWNGDTSTAARFFYQVDWSLDIAERLARTDPAAYVAKASRAEREAGLDPRQIALMRAIDDNADSFPETTVDDGRKKCIDNPYQRGETARRNTHPTIKPLTLTRYLATLLLPPPCYADRRLLVPFAGTGSEMIGAMLAGWESVEGLELESEHVRIAQARIVYWQQRKHELQTTDRPITVRTTSMDVGQYDMFEDAA